MPNDLLFQASRLTISTLFRAYFRLEYTGVEKVPREGPMIVAPNHVSYLDPMLVSIPVTRPLRYMTWEGITKLPLLGQLIRIYGAFPVKVNQGDRAALRISLEQLRAGGGLVIFPEGARTRTGRLMPFKPGVIRLALESNVPIVPVTIIGGYRAFAAHHLFPRPYKIKIIYHDPIHLDDRVPDSEIKEYMRRQTERLQSIVASALPPESLPIPEHSSLGSFSAE